jgi:hypothetical protein
VTLYGPAQQCSGPNCYPDYDLYGRRGSKPTVSGNPCEAKSISADEKCTIQNPQAGKWYFEVFEYNPPPEDNNKYRIKADYRP